LTFAVLRALSTLGPTLKTAPALLLLPAAIVTFSAVAATVAAAFTAFARFAVFFRFPVVTFTAITTRTLLPPVGALGSLGTLGSFGAVFSRSSRFNTAGVQAFCRGVGCSRQFGQRQLAVYILFVDSRVCSLILKRTALWPIAAVMRPLHRASVQGVPSR
jgi:hypothetical protein